MKTVNVLVERQRIRGVKGDFKVILGESENPKK